MDHFLVHVFQQFVIFLYVYLFACVSQNSSLMDDSTNQAETLCGP